MGTVLSDFSVNLNYSKIFKVSLKKGGEMRKKKVDEREIRPTH